MSQHIKRNNKNQAYRGASTRGHTSILYKTLDKSTAARSKLLAAKLLFTENNRNGRTDTEFAFDGKLRVRNSADVLDDGKTESCATDTPGVGFIHSVEALAQAWQMLFFNTIPKVLDELSSNPLKFVLFIDDLSFPADDDNFNALKAVLEGSVTAKSSNMVIYATSNRRHIIKETFSDREGDDVHRNDTMQELISLSERFGIHITFSKPSKQTFLHNVHIWRKKTMSKCPPTSLICLQNALL